MPSFSFQKSIKNASKLRLGRHHFFDWFLHRFFIDFPWIWETNLGLCWLLRRTQDASKRPPRRLPRRSARQFSILIEFWSILGRFLLDFWSIFDWFWFDFRLIFHRFSIDFRQIFYRCSIDFLWIWVDLGGSWVGVGVDLGWTGTWVDLGWIWDGFQVMWIGFDRFSIDFP